jgi:hypothetical protein
VDRVSFLHAVDEQGVDRLFTLPLADFVTARNDLARALKVAGDKQTAARIQKLPKPSISAWAINQLVRKERALLDAMLATLDRQRTLQVAGLNAGIDRDAMKEAKQEENETIGRIERALPAILEADGHASGRATIERCVRALRAAAVHPEGRKLLEAGHLTIDFDAPGFEALGAVLAESEEPRLRIVDAAEEKRRAKEERLAEMQRQRIEAQQKIEEDRRRIEEQQARSRAEPAKAPAPREPAPREVDLPKQSARAGEADQLLGSLRVEKAKLEERAHALQDELSRARSALERAERDAAKVNEELARKESQIAKLEQMLGLSQEGEDDA